VIVGMIQPPAEMVHWMFAVGFLLLALLLAAEGVVGEEVWRMRKWRAYLWPGLLFFLGVMLWPVMTFYTNSAIHMLAHGSWAQTMMLAGAAQLGLVSGKLRSRGWELTLPLAMFVSATAVLLHEQNPWFFSRSAFLHHLEGWVFVGAAAVQLFRVWRPRAPVIQGSLATVMLIGAVMLFADRDLAPIFGHLDKLAGIPHR
jgi:hypothetical protein